MTVIKINYITKYETIKPLLVDFFSNIPNKNHHIYYNNNLEEYIETNITENIILFNEKNIKKANYLLNKYVSEVFSNNNNKNEWYICITKDNFMFNYPFTLKNIIFLPKKYILSCIENENNTEYIITLIHEQIHIYQRYNINTWNDNIQKYSNWKLLEKDYVYNNNNIVYNPDTLYNNNQYGFIHNNEIYVGYLNKNIKPEWINITNNTISNDEKLPKYEHPYEELAYNISKDIVEKQ
jgi:hypothetical protein